jgi:hypothetical protein
VADDCPLTNGHGTGTVYAWLSEDAASCEIVQGPSEERSHGIKEGSSFGGIGNGNSDRAACCYL